MPSAASSQSMSLAQRIAALPQQLRAEALAEISGDDAHVLKHAWRFWARASQLEPAGDWDTWVVLAGRAYGKTRLGSGWVHEKVEQGHLFLGLVAPTAGDARDTLVEKVSGIVRTAHPDFCPTYEPSKRLLTWPAIRGARPIATLFSAEEPERLRGPEHSAVWLDEFGAYGRNAQDVWDQVQFGLRNADNPRSLITTTGRPLPALRKIVNDPRTIVTRGHTRENTALPKKFIRKMLADYEGTRLGLQELGGDILDDNPGALFKASIIESHRAYAPLGFVEIAIILDPAVSNRKGSDETGIIVEALGSDDRVYVLEDLSGKHEASSWAEIALTAALRWKASKPYIIAETNRGGNLVSNTLRAYRAGAARGGKVDPRALELEDMARKIRIEEVYSREDKATRATPVATAYERGRVSHVIGAKLEALELQLTSWDPSVPKSPDRLDALVWGVTKLLRLDEKKPDVGEYKSMTSASRMAKSARHSDASAWDEDDD